MKTSTLDLPLLKYLEERGITSDGLVNTASELFAPHPGVETKEKAAKLLEEEFREALSDVNACMHVICVFIL